MFLDIYLYFCLIVIRYKHSSWNLERWKSFSCVKAGPFNIENSISSSLEVGLWWFKILWKEKKISNFVVRHFFPVLESSRRKMRNKIEASSCLWCCQVWPFITLSLVSSAMELRLRWFLWYWKVYSKIYNRYFYLQGQIPTILTATELESV